MRIRQTLGAAAGMLAMTAATTAWAQDAFSIPGTSPMDHIQMQRALTSSVINNDTLTGVITRKYGAGAAPRNYTSRPGGMVAGGPAGGRLVSGSVAVPPGAVRAVAFPYRPTPADAAQAKAAFLQRLQQNAPQHAAAFAQQIQRNDIDRIYAGITGPFGLSPADAGDVMTAYFVLGWMIATGGPDPSPAAVRAARLQVGTLEAGRGPLADPATRTQLAEELKILFVTLHAGWQGARREGQVRQYADGVDALFRDKGGQELRRLVLTNAGFRQAG